MPRGIFLVLAALLMGGLATWLTAGWLDRAAQAGAGTAQSGIQTVKIMVAARDLKPGDMLGPGMLAWQEWPQSAALPEHQILGVATPSSLAGAMVRVVVSKGEPLLQAHLVKRGDQGIMAALIAPGFRAVTIAVTASSGMAGFVGPGDRVDIVLTSSLPGNGGNRIVGQTVVDAVRVLGIDQRVDPVGKVALEEDARFSPPTTVTLEVTPRQAEMIAVAQEVGKLSLSLRHLGAQQADVKAAAGVPPEQGGQTWDTDVTRLPASAFQAAATGLSMAAAGPAEQPLGSGAAAGSGLAPAEQASVGLASAGLAEPAGQMAAGQVQRVNGVEIVRGSTNREASGAAQAPAAPAGAAQ